MAKKSILYIITKSVWGGAQKYVYDLAVNLPKKDYYVFVAAGPEPATPKIGNGKINGQENLVKKLREKNIPYYKIKNFQRDVNVFKDILAFFEIIKLLFKIKPDIVHTSSSKAAGIAGPAILIYKFITLRFSLYAIFTVHGWAFLEERPLWQIHLIKLASKITCLFYNKIICVSEFDKQSAIKNKIAASKKLITIHNGINFNEYHFFTKESARKKLITAYHLPGNSANLLWIGTIGEFTKNKGHKYLIKAIKKLKAKNYKLKAVIIGWGEEISNLKSQISNLKLEKNIFIIESLPNAPLYLKAFDIFVLPSLKEGLPYTLLEAGLARLPTAATNVGGIPEIIKDHSTGLLVKPKKSQALAQAIEELIENINLKSEVAFELWGKINRKFRLEQMLNATLAVYSNKTESGKQNHSQSN